MDAYIGTILAWAPTFAPQGWMFCSGQTLPINQYQAVFALIGTTYGGDGRTNFCLPNLCGRHPIGSSTMGQVPGLTPHPLGAVGGQESITPVLPSHTHTADTSVNVSTLTTGSVTPAAGSMLAATAAGTPPAAAVYLPAATNPGATVKLGGVATTVTPAGTPASAQSVMNPYLALNYIICIQGLFPSRD